MKTAYVSMHVALPKTQGEHEVSYPGYRRIPVQFDESFGDVPTKIEFPAAEEIIDGEFTHVCIGENERGDGESFMIIGFRSPIKLIQEMPPSVIIMNEHGDGLPGRLNPVARAIIAAIKSGELTVEGLPPVVFEAVNSALELVGAPILTVTRSAVATMSGGATFGG